MLPADVRGSEQGVQLLKLLLRHWPDNVWPVRESVWLREIANKCTKHISISAAGDASQAIDINGKQVWTGKPELLAREEVFTHTEAGVVRAAAN